MAFEPEFFNPRGKLTSHVRRLPHWQQDRVAVFITWRLADSIPADVRAQWHKDREIWIRAHPEPWDAQTENDYHANFSDRFDAWLDAGNGSCVLRDFAARALVAAVLRHRDGRDYDLHASSSCRITSMW